MRILREDHLLVAVNKWMREKFSASPAELLYDLSIIHKVGEPFMESNLSDLSNPALIRYLSRHPRSSSAWQEFLRRFNRFIFAKVDSFCTYYEAVAPLRRLAIDKNDVVSLVYEKLVEKNFRVLREFSSENEQAFYAYLTATVQTVVLNLLEKANARKRSATIQSLDAMIDFKDDGPLRTQLDFIPVLDDSPDASLRARDAYSQLDRVLHEIVKGSNKERDILIFKLACIEGLRPVEIAGRFAFGLSAKRIGNIVAQTKHLLQNLMNKQPVSGI